MLDTNKCYSMQKFRTSPDLNDLLFTSHLIFFQCFSFMTWDYSIPTGDCHCLGMPQWFPSPNNWDFKIKVKEKLAGHIYSIFFKKYYNIDKCIFIISGINNKNCTPSDRALWWVQPTTLWLILYIHKCTQQHKKIHKYCPSWNYVKPCVAVDHVTIPPPLVWDLQNYGPIGRCNKEHKHQLSVCYSWTNNHSLQRKQLNMMHCFTWWDCAY